MGKRDSEYEVCGMVELDEGFFSTEVPDDEKDNALGAHCHRRRLGRSSHRGFLQTYVFNENGLFDEYFGYKCYICRNQ